MTQDLQDLLNLIKELEERILLLETKSAELQSKSADLVDGWYWDH